MNERRAGRALTATPQPAGAERQSTASPHWGHAVVRAGTGTVVDAPGTPIVAEIAKVYSQNS